MILAIDTATRSMSLALHDGDTLLAEQSWVAGNRHNTALAPAIDHMLSSQRVAASDLTALAVSTGPGSYTGLRIGVALAKGMAAARHLPLVGVSTLDTLAAGQPFYQSGIALIAVVQAGRGRIIVNSYRWRRGRWFSHAEPRLLDWETLLASLDGPAHITGEIDEDGVEMINDAQTRDIRVTLAAPAQRMRRAGYLAEVALERLAETDDKSVFEASRVLPVYVKTSDDDDDDSASDDNSPTSADSDTPAASDSSTDNDSNNTDKSDTPAT